LDTPVLFAHQNLGFFHSDPRTNIVPYLSASLRRGLHTAPTLLLWQLHRSS